MLFFGNYFYFITLGLQAICVIHCIRTGRQTNWIWLIVFLPVLGSLIYLFTEMINGQAIQKVQSGMGGVFNSSGRIKKLENNLRFSDTFNNKVALADACMAAGQTQRATDLYESSLVGNFTENEYVLGQLVMAYFQLKRYDDLIATAKKILKLPQFARSHAHIRYAIALDYTGHPEEAEAEFKTMKGRFANFEARYQYGCFLARQGRTDEARQVFTEMLGEVTHLSAREKRNNRNWFALAKDELRKI